jgi:hypothetical protein
MTSGSGEVEEFIERLGATFEQIMKKLRAETSRDVPGSIFHYTSIDAMHSIFKNKKLWASNTRFLNDSMEFEFAREFCERKVKIERSSTNASGKRPNAAENLFIQTIRSAVAPGGEVQNTYATCLTQNGDQLSQWRGYGKTRGAIAIEMDSNALQTVSDQGLVKVSYNSDLLEQTIECYLENTKKIFVDLYRGQNESELTEALTGAFVAHFSILASYFKHPGFAEEEEVRVVLPGWNEALNEVHFRGGNGWLVPYIEIDIGPIFDNLIRGVRIGPSTNTELAQMSIREMLRMFGMNTVSVSSSEIPYRT